MLDESLNAARSVPRLATLGPWQIQSKALKEVEYRPGENNNVVYVEQSNDDHGCVADSWNNVTLAYKANTTIRYLRAAAAAASSTCGLVSGPPVSQQSPFELCITMQVTIKKDIKINIFL